MCCIGAYPLAVGRCMPSKKIRAARGTTVPPVPPAGTSRTTSEYTGGVRAHVWARVHGWIGESRRWSDSSVGGSPPASHTTDAERVEEKLVFVPNAPAHQSSGDELEAQHWKVTPTRGVPNRPRPSCRIFLTPAYSLMQANYFSVPLFHTTYQSSPSTKQLLLAPSSTPPAMFGRFSFFVAGSFFGAYVAQSYTVSWISEKLQGLRMKHRSCMVVSRSGLITVVVAACFVVDSECG